MRYKTKLKTGEFSRLMQVTVKTLRHYEQRGLLLPDEVDQWTGYRHYGIEQMQRLNEIRQLQQMGFSLDEIADLLEKDAHAPSIGQIDEKIKQTEQQLQLLLARRERLTCWRDSRQTIMTMDNFIIQSLPEIIVASHREIIPNYAALGPLCCQKIGPAMMEAGCRCTQPGYCFTIDHNKEYKLEDVDIEYCEQVEEILDSTDFIQFKRLPAIPKALCLKHVGPYERFYESFSKALRYLEEKGYHIAGDPRFSYVDGAWNQEDPEKWVSIIQIPISENEE
ncbi:MAG: MerR family transcriptional regulator [Bacteroidales bacterium]|nr:MerR family transcriptional regulator [Bacteroidales bacterium]